MNSISSLNSFAYTRQANSASAYSKNNANSSGFNIELQGVLDNSSMHSDLSDMYISSNQYSIPLTERSSVSMDVYNARTKAFSLGTMSIKNVPDVMEISLTKNELPELMKNIEKALANGETLESALKTHNDNHVQKFGCYGGTVYGDSMHIDIKTGEVIDSHFYCREGGYFSPSEFFQEHDTIKSIADDFATFIRYRAFPKEGDNPEDVERLISENKSKQDSYDTSRFDFSLDGATGNSDIDLIVGLIEDKASEKDDTDPIDTFISMIGRHQDEQYEKLEDFRKIESLDFINKPILEPNTTLRWYSDPTSVTMEELDSIKNSSILVTLGENQLVELMTEIENAMLDGKSYIDAIQKSIIIKVT